MNIAALLQLWKHLKTMSACTLEKKLFTAQTFTRNSPQIEPFFVSFSVSTSLMYPLWSAQSSRYVCIMLYMLFKGVPKRVLGFCDKEWLNFEGCSRKLISRCAEIYKQSETVPESSLSIQKRNHRLSTTIISLYCTDLEGEFWLSESSPGGNPEFTSVKVNALIN